MDPNTVLTVLSDQLASDAYEVRPISNVNSILTFRPITTVEQKKLSKLILPLQTDHFAETYAVSMGLIQSTSIDKKLIDFDALTEIDRIIIISEFLTRNYTLPIFNVPCRSISNDKKQKCAGELQIKFTSNELITKIGSVGAEYFKKQNLTLSNESRDGIVVYEFELDYPSINLMYQFEQYLDSEEVVDIVTEQSKESDSDRLEIIRIRSEKILTNEIFPLIFIKKLKITKDSKVIVDADLTKFTLNNIIEMFSLIPLHLFTQENGLNNVIQQKFIIPLFKYTSIDVTCKTCGRKYQEVMSFYAFFI